MCGTKAQAVYTTIIAAGTRLCVCWGYLEADHGEEGPHHWVKVVENVGFTQRILRLCEVTQLQRGGRRKGRRYRLTVNSA